MNARRDRELMRLLHGELTPERTRELSAEVRRDPELAAAYERLVGLWRGLELPPPTPVPPGFAARVMSRARAAAANGPGLAAAPGWVRAAAALCLAAGLALGAAVGVWQEVGLAATPDEGIAEIGSDLGSELADSSGLAEAPSLADAYWEALGAESSGEGGDGQETSP